MPQLYLREGKNGTLIHLFPGNGQDGFIQIIMDLTPGKNLGISGKIKSLTVQKCCSLVQQPLQFRWTVGFAVTGRVRHGCGHGSVADFIFDDLLRGSFTKYDFGKIILNFRLVIFHDGKGDAGLLLFLLHRLEGKEHQYGSRGCQKNAGKGRIG